MKIYATRTEPSREVTTCTHLVCDICGAKSSRPESWGVNSYDVNETTVKHRTGSQYPEGGYGEVREIDLCPTCFKERLIPWLQSQGATIKPEPWDW